MGWKNISKDIRDALLERRSNGELVEVLAGEVGMRPTTLDRRLRDHARSTKPGEPDSPSVTYNEHGNVATIKSKSGRVKTLQDLLRVAGVDKDAWHVVDWGVKKWEVGAKVKEGDLYFTDGRIDGEIHHRGLGIEELWSVWAKLVRKNPIALHPTIKPVVCNVAYKKAKTPNQTGVYRTIIAADPHLGFSRDLATAKLDPFHDRSALDLFLQITEHEKPDNVYILGDFFDFVMWTDKFLRSPKFEYTTQPAIIEGHWWLRQLREASPNSRIVIHPGNHDIRMRNAIIAHLRAAYGLRAADEIGMPQALSPQRLLALHKLDIGWADDDWPDDLSWVNKGLALEHGSIARKGGGMTAKAIVNDSTYSKVFGHVHRKEMASRAIYGVEGHKMITAYSPGCLCRVDGVVPGRSKQQDWHQGIAIIDHDNDNMFSIHDINIYGKRAVWDKRIFTARDRVGDLKKDNKDWNW